MLNHKKQFNEKKLFLTIGSVLIAATASVLVCLNNGKTDDIFNRNVDALANYEGGSSTCETRITTQQNRRTFYCGTCGWVENSKPTWDSSTKSCN